MEEVHAAYITSSIEPTDREELPDSTNKQLADKMEDIKKEIMTMPKDPDLFKNHQLPLARIKKIMKSDEDVRVPFAVIQDDLFGDASTVRKGVRNIHHRAYAPRMAPHRRSQTPHTSKERHRSLHRKHVDFRLPHRHHPEGRFEEQEAGSHSDA